LEQRNIVLLFCTMMWFVNQFIKMALPILLLLVAKEFSLSYTDAGILVTTYLVVSALMQLPTGQLANRVGSKKILAFGISFLSASSILVAVSTSYLHFFILQILTAIGSGCHLSVATALISNLFSERERGTAIGTHESAVSLGALLSSSVTMPLAILVGWRLVFLAYGVFGLSLAGIVWMLMPNTERSEKERLPKPRHGQGEFTTRILTLFSVLALHVFVYQAIYAFLPSYLSAEKGIPLFYVGYYVAVPHLLGVFGRPLGGYMSDRVGRRRMTLLSLVSLASGLLLTILVPSGYMLVLTLSLLGFGLHSAIPVLFAFLTDLFSPSRRALILGRFNTVRLLIGGISPVIVGIVVDSAGFLPAFLALVLSVTASFSLALKVFEKNSEHTTGR
jgi:MFS family permease